MDIQTVLDHLENTIIEDLDEMTAKDRAIFWAQLKEFNQAKLQRTTAAPLSNQETHFTVEIVKNES